MVGWLFLEVLDEMVRGENTGEKREYIYTKKTEASSPESFQGVQWVLAEAMEQKQKTGLLPIRPAVFGR